MLFDTGGMVRHQRLGGNPDASLYFVLSDICVVAPHVYGHPENSADSDFERLEATPDDGY